MHTHSQFCAVLGIQTRTFCTLDKQPANTAASTPSYQHCCLRVIFFLPVLPRGGHFPLYEESVTLSFGSVFPSLLYPISQQESLFWPLPTTIVQHFFSCGPALCSLWLFRSPQLDFHFQSHQGFKFLSWLYIQIQSQAIVLSLFKETQRTFC